MRSWAPRLVLAATVMAVLVGTFLLPPAEPVEPLFNRLNGVAFAVVGVLACRRPEGRRIGWLCLTIGLTAVLFDVSAAYAETAGPGARWAYWFGEWMSLPQPVLVLVVLPALFPTGHPLTPRWRWLVPTAMVLLLGAMVSAALAVDTYEVDAGSLGENPLAAPPALDAVLAPLFAITALGGLACAVLALASMVLRLRRATGIERLQLRWLVFGVGTLIGMVIALLALVSLEQFGGVEAGSVAESVIDGSFGAVQLVLPASIGVALTRYRLYELDRVLSRTVAYSLLVAVLAAVYLGLVVGLGGLARGVTGESGDLVVALSTLAVAGLFQPVRRRIQAAVDHRFDRRRYDAAQTAAAFGRRLRDELDLTRLTQDLALVTRTTMQPVHTGVWIAAGPEEADP